MPEKKPVVSRSEETLNAGERTIRSYEEALNATPEPPMPSQEEADAIKEGTYEHEVEPIPEGETQEQRQQREEQKRQRREAKAQSDQQAGYQTR